MYLYNILSSPVCRPHPAALIKRFGVLGRTDSGTIIVIIINNHRPTRYVIYCVIITLYIIYMYVCVKLLFYTRRLRRPDGPWILRCVLLYTPSSSNPTEPAPTQSFRVNTPYIVCRIAVKYFTRRVVGDVLLYYMAPLFCRRTFLLFCRNRITGKSHRKSTANDDGITVATGYKCTRRSSIVSVIL